MTIACVILNYNDSETTISLLKRIHNYDSIDYLVIVDNNSLDDSLNKLSEYKGKNIHVIKAENNHGYGSGNNFGIRYAYRELKADYILIVNPDVEFSNKLVKKLEAVIKAKECNAIASALPVTNKGFVQSNAAWNVPNALKYLLITSSIFSKLMKPFYLNETDYKSIPIFEVDCVPGSLLMVKTDIMINHGMYDESIFLYCEETVLGIKLKKAGYKTLLLTNISYIHHHSISINKSFKSKVKRCSLLYKSKIIVLKKYYGLNSILLLISKFFLVLCSFEVKCSNYFKR